MKGCWLCWWGECTKHADGDFSLVAESDTGGTSVPDTCARTGHHMHLGDRICMMCGTWLGPEPSA